MGIESMTSNAAPPDTKLSKPVIAAARRIRNEWEMEPDIIDDILTSPLIVIGYFSATAISPLGPDQFAGPNKGEGEELDRQTRDMRSGVNLDLALQAWQLLRVDTGIVRFLRGFEYAPRSNIHCRIASSVPTRNCGSCGIA
jgi:hypothetical protein